MKVSDLVELAKTPTDRRTDIVTDAGFRGPWFRAVEALGWDWVGRIRNKIKYFNEATGRWCFTDSLYKQATPVTRHLGEAVLSRRYGYRFRMYLVRAPAPAVGGRRRAARRNPNAKLYRRLHRAPWLLGTSLPHEFDSARRIKQLYAQLMQIEETFRDTKCLRWASVCATRAARARAGSTFSCSWPHWPRSCSGWWALPGARST